MDQSVSIDNAIQVLNDMLSLDPEATHKLIETRYPCNKHMADHPTVQVMDSDGGTVVGFLGVLNGIFGTDERGWGFICAEFNDDGKLTRFKRTPLGS